MSSETHLLHSMVTVVNNNVLIYLRFAKTVDIKCSGCSIFIHAFVLLRGLKVKKNPVLTRKISFRWLRGQSLGSHILPRPAPTLVLSCYCSMVLARLAVRCSVGFPQPNSRSSVTQRSLEETRAQLQHLSPKRSCLLQTCLTFSARAHLSPEKY